MVPTPKQNEFNLGPRMPRERPTLEQMRRRLASAPAEPPPKPESPRKLRARRNKRRTLALMVALAALLVGLNFLARSQKDAILEAVGVRTLSAPLASPPGLSLDDRARFWAYAAFDQGKLRERFKVPASAFIDRVDARHHLEDLLTRELGAQARAEVLALRNPSPEGAAR
ncbi:MAG TPA: hypothetical protein VJ385_12505 [Fibrobacteria bacterium]|nr:hypothetical protein [Fibrobacteria bacterium]